MEVFSKCLLDVIKKKYTVNVATECHPVKGEACKNMRVCFNAPHLPGLAS